jgi:hypothetical protein
MIGRQGRFVVRARGSGMPSGIGSDRLDRNHRKRSGDVPLDADSNQKALQESESQTLRRRCGREVL